MDPVHARHRRRGRGSKNSPTALAPEYFFRCIGVVLAVVSRLHSFQINPSSFQSPFVCRAFGPTHIAPGPGNARCIQPMIGSSLCRVAQKILRPTSKKNLLLRTSLSTTSSSSAMPSQGYPRPLHPGGFSLPPLEEDLLPIVTKSATKNKTSDNGLLKSNIILIKPPDPESLWEWYAYTKRQTDSDPSWGRVWPTALALARLVLRTLHDDSSFDFSVDKKEKLDADYISDNRNNDNILSEAMEALRTASHAVELGCGLGVTGLAYASAASACSSSTSENSHNNKENITMNCSHPRTITFLDREPYALHCVMSSTSMNGWATAPIAPLTLTGDETDNSVPAIAVRAAIDDWTIPQTSSEEGAESTSKIKNIGYEDLHLGALPSLDQSSNNSQQEEKREKHPMYQNQNTILLASDILYEPSSMASLAQKLFNLLHPINRGYALIADPEKERTAGCREEFVKSVQELGGMVKILPLPLDGNGVGGGGNGLAGSSESQFMVESDVDIDGNVAKTVLIVVRFQGEAKDASDGNH